MADNLSIKITADVVDLQAKMAIAKAELSAATSEMNKMARAAASSGVGAAMSAQMTVAAEAMVAAKARMADLRAELSPTEGGFSSLAKAIEQANAPLTSLTSLAAKGGEIFGIGLGIEKLTELARGFADLGDEIAKAMVTTGMSAEQLSALRVVAAENDVEFGQLTRAMTVFARNIQEAESGSKKQVAAFQALGISSAELKAHGNDLGAMLEVVSAKLNQYADGGNKAALESAIFGGRIQGLAPILADIAQNGMAGLEQHAAELGTLFSGPMAEAAEKAHKNFVDFGISVNTLWNEIGEYLIPYVTQAINELNALFSSGNNVAVVAQLNAELKTTESAIDAAKARLADDNLFQRFFDNKIIEDDQARIGEITKQLEALRNESGQLIKIPEMPEVKKPQAPSLGALSDTGAASELEKFRATVAQMEADWRGTHTAMLAQALQMWQQESLSAKLNQKEKTEALTSYANAVKAYNDAQRSENQQIDKLDADTSVQVAKIKLQAERDRLQAEVDAGKLTAAQKADALRALASEEYSINAQRLQDELKNLYELPVEYKRVYDQIVVLKEQHAADMAKIGAQEAQAQKAEVDKLAQQYQQALRPISSAFDSTIKGMLQGTMTWRQAELNLANSVASAFIDDAEKMAMKWITTELAKTTATEIGAAARSTAETAGQDASLLGMAASAIKAITIDAAQTFGNVFAHDSAAEGPYAAIPAAASAALVLGELSMVSAAGGMWSVPGDMVAKIHNQESIIPAAVATPMRSFFENGGAQGGGGGGGDIHIEQHLHISTMDGSSVTAHANKFAPVYANAIKNVLQRNPGMRGNY